MGEGWYVNRIVKDKWEFSKLPIKMAQRLEESMELRCQVGGDTGQGQAGINHQSPDPPRVLASQDSSLPVS